MKNALIEQLLEEVYLCEGSPWRPRAIRNLSESGQKEMANKTVTSLFRAIKAKAFNLDFSDVEVGKGDITKIHSYKELKEAISFLKKLSTNINSPEINNAISQIEMAHTYLLSNKQGFVMGFKLGNNLIIYLFNSVAIALVQATSFLISNCIEITKNNINTYQCEMKKVNKLPKNASLSALIKFNEMGKNGKLSTVISHTIKLKEDALSITMGVVGGVMLALFLIREVIYMYYFVRVSFSQYLNHLKEFVLMNASTLSNDQRGIKDKQEKVAKKLGELSDKLAIDQSMATERSRQDINSSNRVTANTNTPDNSGELADILY